MHILVATFFGKIAMFMIHYHYLEIFGAGRSVTSGVARGMNPPVVSLRWKSTVRPS